MRRVQKVLVYLSVLFGIIGPAFMAFPVGPIHIFPYRVIVPFIWLFFIAEVILRHGKIVISRIKSIKIYLQFFMIWLIYALLSIVWTLDKIAAVKEIISLFMGVSIVFFMVYFLSDKKGVWNLYKLWIFLLTMVLPIALWEIFTGNHLHISGLYTYQPTKATNEYVKFMPSVIFHNPNDFATFLALSVPFVLVWIRYAKKVVIRVIALAELLLAFYVLLMTYSRANYIAVMIEFAFLFFVILKLNGKIRFVVSLMFLGLFVGVIQPGLIVKIAGLFMGQVTSLLDPDAFYSGSVFVRINLIKNSFVFLWKTFGFGVGAGNAEYWMENFAVYNTLGILNVHNWWVEILVNFGIFIFAGYILFYVGLIKNIYKIYNQNPRLPSTSIKSYSRINKSHDKMIGESLLLSLIGFFMASISSSSIMTLRPQWFLLGFALAFLNYKRNQWKNKICTS